MRGKRFAKGAVLVYLFVGCGPGDCGPSLSFDASATNGSSQGCSAGPSYGGCQYGPGLAGTQGTLQLGAFTYVCPSAAGARADAWCVANGLLASAEGAALADAAEESEGGDAATTPAASGAALAALGGADAGNPLLVGIGLGLGDRVPDVAIGAPFQLAYTPYMDTGGLGAPAPLLAGLVDRVSGGSAFAANEWAAYAVWQGSSVFDFTHVHGRPIASLRVVAATQPDASFVATSSTTTITALPLSVDGSLLAGALDCTFSTSDATVATVTGSGVTAVLTALAAGTVTVSVTCLGVTGETTVEVAVPAAVADAGEQDGAEDTANPVIDGPASDGPDEEPGEAGDGGLLDDAGAEAEANAGEGG